MNQRTSARLLVPATVVLAGTAIAVAVGVGHTWSGALVAEAVTIVIAAAYYVATGRDSDVGAIYGQRSDERQATVLLQASRRAFVVMMVAAFVCAVVTVALNVSYWQADVIGSVGSCTFLLSLLIQGAPSRRISGKRGVMETASESSDSDRPEHVSADV